MSYDGHRSDSAIDSAIDSAVGSTLDTPIDNPVDAAGPEAGDVSTAASVTAPVTQQLPLPGPPAAEPELVIVAEPKAQPAQPQAVPSQPVPSQAAQSQPPRSRKPLARLAVAAATKLPSNRLVMGLSVLLVCAAAALLFPRNGSDSPDRTTVIRQSVLPTVAVEVQTPTTVGRLTPTTLEPPPPPVLDPDPYFVSPTLGDDANNGQSFEQPWASLAAALERLQPGQTLYLMDGTYSELHHENFHYVARAGGTAEAWVRITAAPGHQPLILATEGTALEVQANYVEVSGLTIRGEGFNVENSFGVGLNARRSQHVRFANNSISDMPLAGISAIESSNIEVINNEVFNNALWSDSQGSGISIWHSLDWGQPPDADGYHDRIIGNRVYGNENRVKSKWKNYRVITDGNGIIIDQNRDFNYTGRTLVANNVVFDNGGRGILVFESNRVDVLFNTSYHNGRTDGLEGGPVELAAGEANDVRFLNNLAWALPGGPAFRSVSSSGVETAGNVMITTNPRGQASDRDTVLSTDPGVANPSLDPLSADFRPDPTGFLVDRALDLSPSLAYDVLGNPRDPASADVGAYELGAP